jgi:asparagine synthetase B (glutamine-hydrolysing)
MCGLTLSIHAYPPAEEPSSLVESLCKACAARGPDVQSTYRTVITTDTGIQIEVLLCASVLGLRGGVVQQPIVGQRGVLGWNGQVGVPKCMDLEEGDADKVGV